MGVDTPSDHKVFENDSGRLSLAVFISGQGSNLQALIDACADDAFPARIAGVYSNKPEAYGLQRAQDVGIQTYVIDHRAYEDRAAFETALLKMLDDGPAIDVICLAGFMRILSASFIEAFHKEGKNRAIINIHPSLLPAYKGLNTHARALADGASEAGCSVHYVTPDLDSGDIIVQKRVPILADDTPETLASRVLEQEHSAYPQAIEQLAKSLLSR